MAEVLKEIQSPLATELAEYILMRQDLQLASNTIKIWFTKYGDLDAITAAQDDLLIGQSLFRDAVVMVISCFDKSAPLRLFPAAFAVNTSSGTGAHNPCRRGGSRRGASRRAWGR